MCLRALTEFGAQATAPAAARAFVSEQCRDWSVDGVAHAAALLVSELVTNAVLHAATAITVTIALTDGGVEVGVADRDGRAPVARPPRKDLLDDIDSLIAKFADVEMAEDERHSDWNIGPAGSVTAGRGLLILAGIADQWGVADRADGKEVWFVLTTPDTRRTALGCPCATPGGYALGSGRRVTVAQRHRIE